MKVLVTAPDLRVRRALCGLLQSAGHRTVEAAHPADLGSALDKGPAADLVVLEAGRDADAQDLATIERLTRLGCSVIAVASRPTRPAAFLAAGAATCLDEDDPGFADQLTDAVRAVTEERGRPGSRSGRPVLRGTAGLRQRAPSEAVIPPMGRRGPRPHTATHLDPGPDVPGTTR